MTTQAEISAAVRGLADARAKGGGPIPNELCEAFPPEAAAIYRVSILLARWAYPDSVDEDQDRLAAHLEKLRRQAAEHTPAGAVVHTPAA